MKLITVPEKCTGCGACFNACPVGAIEMKENANGFLCPVINQEKCIDCGLCSYYCPSKIELNEYVKLTKKQITNYEK